MSNEGAANTGLRLQLVEAATQETDESMRRLQSFLTETDDRAALRVWFGDSGERFDLDRIRAVLARDIAAIDALLSDQVDAILHHEEFRHIEAAWRGVDLLVREAGGDERVRVKLFNASWQELARDFDRAIEFDQSVLFAKVYSEEYGMPGGVPYGLLICDHAVRHRNAPGARSATDDVSTLASLAQVAAAAFSPCIVGAAPELFGLSTFADLSYAQRLDSSFMLAEYQRWKKLRAHDDSRFLGVALPRVLLRNQYGDSDVRQDGFVYREGVSSVDSWLWGNAAFGFGMVTIRAFRQWGWFADICGTRGAEEQGGIMVDLPAPGFSTREASSYRRPLEVELTDKKQKALEELGFIAVSPCNFSTSVVFLGSASLNAASGEGEPAEQANARMSGMLQYVLCVCRFAHYVKVMARDRLGAFTTSQDLERYLGDWLRDYTIGNTDAGPELKARFPLAGASVEMKEVVGRPGVFNCVMHLQPHFQFDRAVSNFKLRTEMASAR